MQTKWKALIITLVIAVPAFMLGGGTPIGADLWNAVWPFSTPSEAEPSGAQIPLLMLFGALEALSFGLAVAFLVIGVPLMRRLTGAGRTRATLMTVAVAWVIGNWWIHDNLHMVNGEDFWGLIVLEYAFHVTLMAAGAYLALNLLRLVRSGRLDEPESPEPAAATAPA